MSMRIPWTTAVLALTLALAGTYAACRKTASGASGTDAADVLLRDDDIIGLACSGDKAYAGNDNALYDLINGGAPVYIDNGFEELVIQSYELDSRPYELKVYDMGTVDGSRAVHEEQYPAGGTVLFAGTDREAVTDKSGDAQLRMYQNRFYIEIGGPDNTDAAFNTVKMIGSAVSGRID